MRRRTGSEGSEGEQKYSFTTSLTSALGAGEWLTPRPGHFTPRKQTLYPLYTRTNGPQSGPRRVRKISPATGFLFSSEVLLFFSLHLFPTCLYCTTHTTQRSMPLAGFEPAIPASDRPQTLTLDLSAAVIDFRPPGP